MSEDIIIRYRCTSKSCAAGPSSEPIADHLILVERQGCRICGCKRLEVWHPTRGHFIISWRSQKSARKKERARLTRPKRGT